MSRRTTINLGFFVLVSLAFLTWAVTNIISVDAVKKPYLLKADFASSVGLLPNSEVDYLGVTYGTVAKVDRLPGKVQVTMKMDSDKQVPQGSHAAILRKTVLGEQFVQFTPPDGYQGQKGPYYAKGTTIPMDMTSIPLEFSELLRSAGRLVASIPPEAVNTLVHEAALGLAGRVDSLRQFSDSTDQLSKLFADRNATLDRLATNQTALMKVFADHRTSFGQSLSDLAAVADSLKNARGDTTILLTRGSQLMGQTADLVANQKGNLDCDLKTIELLIDVTTTPQRLDGLRVLLEVSPVAYDRLWDATTVEAGPPGVTNGAGRWIRIGLVTNPNNPPPRYVPPRPLATVAGVPPCVSGLRPVTGLDYRPQTGLASSSGSPRGTLPTTGGNAALALGLGLVAAAAIVRQTSKGVRSQG